MASSPRTLLVRAGAALKPFGVAARAVPAPQSRLQWPHAYERI